jgi:hypothetical protein
VPRGPDPERIYEPARGARLARRLRHVAELARRGCGAIGAGITIRAMATSFVEQTDRGAPGLPPLELPLDVRQALGLLERIERRVRELRTLTPDDTAADVLIERRGSSSKLHQPRSSASGGQGAFTSADRVVLGRASCSLLRVRAFYSAIAMTLVVHGNQAIHRPCRLHRGARVQDRLVGRTALRVPIPLRRGRGWRDAWVLEEALPGDQYPGAEFARVAPSLAAGIAETWTASDTGHGRASELVTEQVLTSLRRLGSIDDGTHPRTNEMLGALEAVGRSRDRLVTAVCHGDPVHSNWLRLGNGAPALVDWESARSRPVGGDLMKLLNGLPDAAPILAAVPQRLFSAPGTAPLPVQVAAAAAAWLANWTQERAVAERLGQLGAYRRRVRQRLDLIEALLA